MKIINVDSTLLTDLCKILSKKIIESDFHPQIVLGIRTGGAVIAEKIYKLLSKDNLTLDYCHPIRSYSSYKKIYINKILRFLPLSILNILRYIEYKKFFSKKKRKSFQKIILPVNITNYKNILLVDDAMDSGETLKAVIRSIKIQNPKANIKTAVLTVTIPNSNYIPDYYIFNNSTLIRFPWSIDSK